MPVSYPQGHPGVYPVDGTTDVGAFRILYGDVNSTPYEPVEPGYQSYDELSDAEIEAFLAQGGGSVTRSIAYLYLSLAGDAAKQSMSIQDHDLRVDLSKRAADLRALAEFWFGREDADGAVEDAFQIVPTGTGHGDFIPEAASPVWGRAYTWARWR
jgi:uncharacterized protein YfiM (DUF2279 family)